mmetsp:Transcript_36161/g.62359  ORF Transcript_36161/g.62359 Transcript_36161/m.62359 type:complete len:368 (-) Transcript_36161:209-1312(-)
MFCHTRPLPAAFSRQIVLIIRAVRVRIKQFYIPRHELFSANFPAQHTTHAPLNDYYTFLCVHRQGTLFGFACIVHQFGKPFFLLVLTRGWLDLHMHVPRLCFDVTTVLHQPLAQLGHVEHFVDQCGGVMFVHFVEQAVFGPEYYIFCQQFRAFVFFLFCMSDFPHPLAHRLLFNRAINQVNFSLHVDINDLVGFVEHCLFFGTETTRPLLDQHQTVSFVIFYEFFLSVGLVDNVQLGVRAVLVGALEPHIALQCGEHFHETMPLQLVEHVRWQHSLGGELEVVLSLDPDQIANNSRRGACFAVQTLVLSVLHGLVDGGDAFCTGEGHVEMARRVRGTVELYNVHRFALEGFVRGGQLFPFLNRKPCV